MISNATAAELLILIADLIAIDIGANPLLIMALVAITVSYGFMTFVGATPKPLFFLVDI